MVKHIDPLIVCITNKQMIREGISKAISREPWPIVFAETPQDAVKMEQENLTSVIIDPMFYTACPSCGELDDWPNTTRRCKCGFKPKKGRILYTDLPAPNRLAVIVLPAGAPKHVVTMLREKGYWAVRMKRENTIFDVPKVVKHSLKTMSKFYRMS